MPSFYVDDVDIDVDEFISACSKSEIKELIDFLVDDGHIKKDAVLTPDKKSRNPLFDDACIKLVGNSWRLSKEDEEVIMNISKKIIE